MNHDRIRHASHQKAFEPRPCEPRIIKSACHFSAASMILDLGVAQLDGCGHLQVLGAQQFSGSSNQRFRRPPLRVLRVFNSGLFDHHFRELRS